MPIGKVWVLAEKGDSGPTPVTLELLTEARAVASTVEAVAWGDDAASLAGPLGEYGATTLYDVGEQNGTSFLVMQYLEGETLEARLAHDADVRSLGCGAKIRVLGCR